MGRWTLEDSGNHDLVRLPNGQWFYADEIEADIHGLHNADCDTYEARIAELEALLRDEVADNVRLRSRYTGDAEANLEQEICDLNNKVTELTATLDRLREVVPEDVKGYTRDEVIAVFFQAQHILHSRHPLPTHTGDTP